jgi:HAD superfamily hydrolase (TIGR01509 family)
MFDYICGRLGCSRQEAELERQRLKAKYDVDCTEYVYNREYGDTLFPIDDFVRKTYLKGIDSFVITENAGLRGLLDRLELPITVMTNNPSAFAEAMLKRTCGIDNFKRIIGSGELGYVLKPKPEAFRKALDIMGNSAEDVLFVDDSPENTMAAKALGLQTRLIVDKQVADGVITSCSELEDLVGPCYGGLVH